MSEAMERMTAPIDAAISMQRRYFDLYTKMATFPLRAFQPALSAFAELPKPITGLASFTRSSPIARVNSQEGVLSVGEEVLQVGKEIVQGDTTRIVRTVEASPVEEDVELVTETVIVERRRPSEAGNSSDVLSERVMEMTATRERPVVSKARRVVEEVVLRREATVHVERVRDTVLRDHVDVQQPNRVPAVIPVKDGREIREDRKENGKHARHG